MSDTGVARFDDLISGTAVRFPRPHTVLAATEPHEVPYALRAVERATELGGWAYGVVAYEAASGLDPALHTHRLQPNSGGFPYAWFAVTAAPRHVPIIAAPELRHGSAWVPGWTDGEHRAAVERVRDHIAAGETYQCNLTDRLRSAVAAGDTERVYAQLAHAQQGRYNALLQVGDHTVVSASPELFFEWSDDAVRTRPMKGTAARAFEVVGDQLVAEQLRASPKERAENLMIVDLLRNDLSRIARTGTVRVTELFTLERYPTVWQLTSEISARMRPEIGLVDVFRALFPCGSVTGAPKARTMELIRLLEPGPRGAYCGAVGVMAPPGNPFRARFSVAIRTAVVDQRDGEAVYGAGGGITWDSRASAERDELLVKARLLGAVRTV